MRKIVLMFMMLIIFPLAAQANPTVILNDQIIKFDVPPTIENGRTLVPLRIIFEALGANVQWDDRTQTVRATKGGTEINLVIGGSAYKNGALVELDVPAKIIDDRTMVPLRFVSESLGAKVNWNDSTNTATITSQDISNGSSIINFPDGSKFIGEVKDGLPHGQGTYAYPDGSIYAGELQFGVKNGQGKYTWPDGSVYIGQWENNNINGQGRYTWPDGVIYIGQWKDGKKDGQGTLITPDGKTYTGEFRNDKPINIPTSRSVVANSLILIADDGKDTYLGKLTTNKSDSESIFNEFGTYGSKFSSESIWNEFGTFGSEFSSYSPFNKFTSTPPKIVSSNGNVVGRLSVNKFVNGSVSPYLILNYLKELGL